MWTLIASLFGKFIAPPVRPIHRIDAARKLAAACEAAIKDNRRVYPEDPPRWADCGCAGPHTEALADALIAFRKLEDTQNG